MKYFWIYLIVGVVMYGGWWMSKQNYQPTPTPALTDEINVKEFKVNGANFRFDPASITVKKGDKVRIVFSSVDLMHDWRVDEFEAQTKVVPAGESDTVEFIADKAGEFEYYCSVGQHRANGMVGQLIVTE